VKASALWNQDRLDNVLRTEMDGLWTAPTNGGAGVSAFVVDTGVDISHGEFQGRATNAFTAFATYTDVSKHGTHVSGTIGGATVGVAKGIAIYSVKVLDGSGGEGTTLTLANGLMYVLAHAPPRSIINLSLGFLGSDSVIASIIQDLIDAGHVVVAAAGNDNTDACSNSPSSLPGVVAVIATNALDVAASFNNYGICVDIGAPGVDIRSAKAGGGYWNLQGTSMATPHVVGVAALYWQMYPSSTASQIVTRVLQTASVGLLTNEKTSPDLLLHWESTASVPPSASHAPQPPPSSGASHHGVFMMTPLLAVCAAQIMMSLRTA